MPLFDASERPFAEVVSALIGVNPFSEKRTDLERQALGQEFQEEGSDVYRSGEGKYFIHPHVEKVGQRVERLVHELHQRRTGSNPPLVGDEEARLYEELVLYHLYSPHRLAFHQAILDQLRDPHAELDRQLWLDFLALFRRFFDGKRESFPSGYRAEDVFAVYFQLRRAFLQTFQTIIGASTAAVRLRESVWKSIFTSDLKRYVRTLGGLEENSATLILGPSGTGKELVARAVGLARFIPFDATRGRFRTNFASSFVPLNLTAFAPTLIEAELFGTARGAFSGAVNREGWLGKCDRWGTVFLDEIGELDPVIQVKLLRVIETRAYQRVGEPEFRKFQGKLICATNRDLAAEMRAGRFRPDFYYRLCADVIHTPALHEQLRDAPGDLHRLVRFIACRVVGEDEADSLTAEVEGWIAREMPDHPWPGNFRELEQCVRNILYQKEYHPARGPAAGRRDARRRLARDVLHGRLSAEELLSRYCTMIYAETGSFKETARRLGVKDPRTVKTRISARLLETFRLE
jgi:DNA-binding NtrC family response regulator